MTDPTQLPTHDLDDDLYSSSPRAAMIEYQIRSQLSERNRRGADLSAVADADYYATESLSPLAPALPRIVIPIPRERGEQSVTFYAIQEWEGVVTEVGEESFVASLVDVTAGDTAETELIELPVSDLTDHGIKKLKPGALFRFSIGYQLTKGSKRRVSEIVFRDLPRWTHREIVSADSKADNRRARIVWDVDTSSTKRD